MTEDELIERLARRLHAIRWENTDRMWGDSTDEKNHCLREARECLRQMQWARREGMDETVTMANRAATRRGDLMHEIDDYGWCTLAPPEWTP